MLHPSDAFDELFPVLDQLKRLLSKVDQSPKKTMLDALKPSMQSLIQDDLLRHSDVDVKVAVASCISKITRIIALDAPYGDDQMRDVFKMFEHFLRSVRDYHRRVIYSSMENIMIFVLEESEDISVEMLKPLLATVKKHNEGVLLIAQKLGEDVPKKSAEKLKPYLMSALTTLGDLLDTYSEIVTKVCEGTTAAMKRDDENDSGIIRSCRPDTDDKLAKSESKPEPTPKTREKKSDTNIDSAEPSDSSHVEGEKEAVKLASEDEKDNDVKESAISAPVQSETEKDNDDVPQQDEVDTENAASPSKSETPLDKSHLKKTGRSKSKDLDQEENTPSVDVKAPKVSSDSDVKPQKRAEKMVVVAKEVKSQATIDSSEDDEAASDLDEEPSLKISKKLEPVNSGLKSKQSGKKAFVTKEVKHPDTIDLSKDDEAASKKEVVTKEAELPDTIDSSEDDKAASDSDDEPPQKVSKKLEPVNSGSKSKQSEGVDLLTRSRGDNLYALSLGDMMASSPIYLLSKASKTKSWLWHRRLSHLNFNAINHLARHGLIRGLLKLKFEKDHLCSACIMGKSKKKS
ncbi:armadillo-type fold protein [Tanacetum coccineum]